LNQEPKSSGKDVNGSASKSNAPPNGTPSSNTGSSNAASGPVTEQEIRAVLMQGTPLTTRELVAKFKGRLRCAEVNSNFALSLFKPNMFA
jgi:transcription initiation factor TFIIF subunit alpha